jgi:hypothetical protein
MLAGQMGVPGQIRTSTGDALDVTPLLGQAAAKLFSVMCL